jgi:methionine-gamma-lyase
MSHVVLPREERLTSGLTDLMIRMAVGLEEIDDVIGDLQQALAFVLQDDKNMRAIQ